MHDCLVLPVAVPHLDVLSDGRTGPAPPGEQLTISTVAAHGRTFVIALRGELDVRTVQQARDILAVQVAAGMHRMVADLSGLQFMGVAGARALLDTQALLIAQGGSMALAHPQRLVARVLQLTGTDQYIPVYETVSGAVRGRVPVPSRAP